MKNYFLSLQTCDSHNCEYGRGNCCEDGGGSGIVDTVFGVWIGCSKNWFRLRQVWIHFCCFYSHFIKTRYNYFHFVTISRCILEQWFFFSKLVISSNLLAHLQWFYSQFRYIWSQKIFLTWLSCGLGSLKYFPCVSSRILRNECNDSFQFSVLSEMKH